MVVETIKHEYKEIVGFLIWVFIMGLLLPTFVLWWLGGISEAEFWTKFLFYGISIAISVPVWVGLKLAQLNKIPYFTGIFHDSTQSLLYNVSGFKWLNSVFKTILVSLLIFIPIGIFSVVTNTFFAATPTLEFQVTPAAELAFALEPAVTGENVLFIVILSILISFFKWLLISKLGWKKEYVTVFLIVVVPILGAAGWTALHTYRYGAQDTAIVAVLIFGYLGSLMSVVFSSFIPWLVWHESNNFFLKIKELFANETAIVVVTLMFLFFVIITYFLLALRKRNKLTKAQIGV